MAPPPIFLPISATGPGKATILSVSLLQVVAVSPVFIFENIKRRQEEEQRNQQKTAEVQLQTDSFIQAKLPDFWASLIECAEADVKRANDTLPNVECALRSKTETSIWLQRKSALPLKGLRLVLNLRGHAINVLLDSEADSMGNPAGTARVEIPVSLITETGRHGSHQALSFWYEGKEYRKAAPLCQALLTFLYAD